MHASIPANAEQRTWMLFQSVYWPAAAGNVLWALINTILYAVSTGAWRAVLPSLAILVVLGTYLSVEWVRNLTGDATMKWWLSFAAIDGAHLVLICAAAIMVTPNVLPPDHIRFLPWVLVTFYSLTAIGHARNVWDFEDARSKGDEQEKRHYRRLAIGSPAFGLGLSLVLGLAVVLTREQWQEPALALALAEECITWACCVILVGTFVVSQYRHRHWLPDVTEQRIAKLKTAAEAKDREAKEQAEREAKAAQEKG